MLVPPDSQLGASKLLYHINKFCNDRVVYRYVRGGKALYYFVFYNALLLTIIVVGAFY